MKFSKDKGFTLIELLVVIGVISLLASVIFASLNVAKAKGRDARKQNDMASVTTALRMYADDHNGQMPKNYNLNGSFNAAGEGNLLAIEDLAHPNDAQTNTAGRAYNQFMEDLRPYLSDRVYSPSGSTYPYTYFNYGPQSAGAVFGTILETLAPSDTGPSGSCRPFVPVGSGDLCVSSISLNEDDARFDSLAAVGAGAPLNEGELNLEPSPLTERPLTSMEAQLYQKCYVQDDTSGTYDNICMRQPSSWVCYCVK